MFMLKCAANSYRLAAEAFAENYNPELIARYLADARYYDEEAKK